MVGPDKAAAVAEMSDQFTRSAGAVLTEYRGLSVQQLQELRRVLGDDATYTIVKNTLTRIAARDAGVDGLDELLVGPSAIAFITGDPVLAAKGLRDFARLHQPLVIKGGVLDGRPVGAAEISRMADLESREVLLARLAGALQASLQNAAYMFNAPLAQAARVLGALRSRLEDQDGVNDPAAPDPAAPEAAAPEAAVAEAAVAEAAVAEAAAAEAAAPEAGTETGSEPARPTTDQDDSAPV